MLYALGWWCEPLLVDRLNSYTVRCANIDADKPITKGAISSAGREQPAHNRQVLRSNRRWPTVINSMVKERYNQIHA